MTLQEAAMRQELIRLMPVRAHDDTGDGWGPNPFICRWCKCWLEYSDETTSKPEEKHGQTCFAAVVLGRPTK